MKTNTSKNISSRKSPILSHFNFRKKQESFYQHMFLEDFCQGFSIDLAKNKTDRPFYEVYPSESSLKNLLAYQNYGFLEYDMDSLLSQVMRALVLTGRAFVEIVILYNAENNPVGISLVQFNPILSLPTFSNSYFVAVQYDGRPKCFKIKKQNVILFRLSDLGFKSNYIKKFYNKLPRFDITKKMDVYFSQKNTGFDFSIWKENQEYELLKSSKKIGWIGRNTHNSFMGDAYLLYRNMQFKSLRKKFLDYFLKQINQSVSIICNDLGVEGEIISKSISCNYGELIDRLNSGEINYSQLGDFVFCNKDIKD